MAKSFLIFLNKNKKKKRLLIHINEIDSLFNKIAILSEKSFDSFLFFVKKFEKYLQEANNINILHILKKNIIYVNENYWRSI